MIWLVVLLVAVSGFLYVVFFGAPYVPTFQKDIDRLLDLSKLKAGDSLVDLGCGDGKVLIAAAKRGIHVSGYEINLVLWLITKWRLRSYQVEKHIYLRSMWRADLSKADAVFLFLQDRWMVKMAKYLQVHCKPGTQVISYVFSFEGLKLRHTTRNAAIYLIE